MLQEVNTQSLYHAHLPVSLITNIKYPADQIMLVGYFTDVFGLHNDASVYITTNIIHLGQSLLITTICYIII